MEYLYVHEYPGPVVDWWESPLHTPYAGSMPGDGAKNSGGAPSAGVLVQIERIIDAALQDARYVVVAYRVCAPVLCASFSPLTWMWGGGHVQNPHRPAPIWRALSLACCVEYRSASRACSQQSRPLPYRERLSCALMHRLAASRRELPSLLCDLGVFGR